MTIQITIVGLGQIGASIGLALAEHKNLIRRVGHDLDNGIARQAEKMGALDQVEWNLINAVSKADVVILSLPVDQVKDTLAAIGPELRENVVVMDTCPVKEVVAAWAQELLPPGRHYVGLTPMLNAAYLQTVDSGVEAAKADLFKGGLVAIVTPPNTHSDAIKLAADLTRLLNATPLFADPLEIDGLMAATHILPQLLAAALLNATVDQPGWREGRKFAGRAYADATAPIVRLDDDGALQTSVMLNRENVLRVLDTVTAAVQVLRKDIELGDEARLKERLARARLGREKWWKERNTSDWSSDGVPPTKMPEYGPFDRLFGIRRKPKESKE